MVVVALRDNVARRFLTVSFCGNDEVACRDFVNAVLSNRGRNDSLLGTNPEDISLWHLCDYDEITGLFDNQEQFVLMSAMGVLSEADSMKEGVSIDE